MLNASSAERTSVKSAIAAEGVEEIILGTEDYQSKEDEHEMYFDGQQNFL